MKEPLGPRYVPGYDLFKLIVAIILTIILIILLLRERDRRFAVLDTPVHMLTATAPIVPPTMTPQPPPSSTPTLTIATTEIPPTETPMAEATLAQAAGVITTPSSDPNECPSNPTRIQVGGTVRVLDWLNFRTSPGLGNTIQQTNRPGTEMEVIGGPVCTQQGGDPPRAYLWWQVRMMDGHEGWSAEAPLNFPNYFLEPVQ